MNKALNHLGAAIALGMPELKARHLDAVKMIFESFNPDDPDESVIMHSWFCELGKPFPMASIQTNFTHHMGMGNKFIVVFLSPPNTNAR